MSEDDQFGRQPLPVTVVLIAQHPDDCYAYLHMLARRAGNAGDLVDHISSNGMVGSFKIYPRAVND